MKILVTGCNGQLGYGLRELESYPSRWSWKFTNSNELNITNKENYKEYIDKVKPLAKKFGAEYIIRGGENKIIEGSWEHPRTVVIRFPSYEKALEWYNSKEYEPIKKIRLENAQSNGIIIKGA